MEDKKKLKEVVEKLLKEDSRSRTNDKWLYIQTLREMGFKVWIDYAELKNMPVPESVSRVRRAIQNQENKYNDFVPEMGVTYSKPMEVMA